MQFAQIFNKVITEKKISAYKMSKDTGISDSLICYWKKGERMPNAENLIVISRYLGVSIDYLLTGNEPIPKSNIPNTIELSNLSLTENEEDILSLLNQLSERNQVKLIGKVEEIVKEMNNSNNPQQENVG